MAVYTDVPDDELRAFVAQFDLGEVVSFKGIAEGVENSNYLLRTERGPTSSPSTSAASRPRTCHSSSRSWSIWRATP